MCFNLKRKGTTKLRAERNFEDTKAIPLNYDYICENHQTKIMELNNSNAEMSVTERDYQEFVQRGDDFFKIELLRQAKIWYKKALELSHNGEDVKHKFAECERLLKYEQKVVYLLMATGSVLFVAYLFFFS
jgi:hypothetical protein